MAKQRPFQAGDLDRKLTLLIKGTHLNTKGGKDGSSYGLFASNVPCQKKDLTGNEAPDTDRETAFGKTEFTIRYRADINETMRVQFEGVDYDIENIREGEVRRQLSILTCKKHN